MPRQPESPFGLLLEAILEHDRDELKALLKAHPSLAVEQVNGADHLEPRCTHYIYTGDTPLHVAAAAYQVGIAKILLAAGADPNAHSNRRASRPLHYAADGSIEDPRWDPNRQVAMIQLLLNAGANIHAQDKNGATPLHRAVRTRCAAAVQFLLDSGADPTIFNKPGSTPFHLAVQNTGRGGSGSDRAKMAQRAIIESFLQHGASPLTADQKGQSVLEWAKSAWIRQILSDSRHSS